MSLVSALDFNRYVPRKYIISEGDTLSARKAKEIEESKTGSQVVSTHPLCFGFIAKFMYQAAERGSVFRNYCYSSRSKGSSILTDNAADCCLITFTRMENTVSDRAPALCRDSSSQRSRDLLHLMRRCISFQGTKLEFTLWASSEPLRGSFSDCRRQD